MAALKVLLFIFSIDFGYKVFASVGGDWNYEDQGPETWSHTFPKCDGLRQSPINLEHYNVVQKTFPPFVFSADFNNDLVFNLKNNGHTVVGELDAAQNQSKPVLQLTGGGLSGVYQFTNFHLHWGGSPTEGSEHTIDGLHGAGEAHFVFRNLITKKLAVLAFFIIASPNEPQSAWRSYVDNAVTLIREGKQVEFVANLMNLMEAENSFQDFWRYDGSLTTPPCTEGVIYIQTKLKSQEFVLVKHKKGQADIWLNDISFIEIASNNDESPIMIQGYAACNHSSKWKDRLKDGELKFVVAGAHSFRSLENDDILAVAQTCTDIGAEYGRMDAKTDLWTDDYVKRTYLDFIVFWLYESWKLRHSLLRCKHFTEDIKSGANICQEIESIYMEFHLYVGDTPITTDQRSNMILALKDEARFSCMAHRTNTVLESAWNNTINEQPIFDAFCTAVKEIRKYVAQSGGIQEHLPRTLKKSSHTRPWRSYFMVHDSLQEPYEA
ncbi:unnamed protein product [Didymodactylos carnosus]|uniref:carbonic anhydrase n=1 Tax=Didymodactylos carnosus TaxID=1234261 RepID=A0A814GMQ4_9BILA|nr:unnamed protein product [Didymodactylos carnosus]CAF0998518.1 unnamed protein product [Didymodactylos carnosus]CAF3593077.1 unnamed protein product [Didymodactylos carnosus]CAF3769952.1 unnamed protein product [Didymodactylos carnosus]